ncbi:precorrin-6Y C5,15-methyltransferase (decarboxylating) subunit CbiT [Lampropedia puyangensis]|uniref:Precorrin-6Y C5,15-methyltransferase (Decarboxylating) subunit CbiT n=1 Tax=Lampropedia puyangensis TaxID=1330072 RepID=A0A4S8F5B0_9BURK|nr:precorrin-6Y C5,15-methyltransferase (decarboxylating) subunit CbiT [Lampropedia puyangensis]THU02021.1 precorrin-6Y C5,15-methyltransferase (decarboxylating) subunit CbiT [Lampropedia puyangensis]
MARAWLSIIGIQEDGLAGLSPAARAALNAAQVVFGAPRHLALAGIEPPRRQPWPVPFSTVSVMALRGQVCVNTGAPSVAVLVSGDPFWFGAGASLAAQLQPGEWKNYAAPSTFSLVAAQLGWRLEHTHCMGLHARPFETLTPSLHHGQRFICLLRDGAAAGALALWLGQQGWGDSPLWIISQAHSPNAYTWHGSAKAMANTLHGHAVQAPVVAAFITQGAAHHQGLSQTPGRPETAFAHDGQISKSPVRAMTLAALAPRPGEHLWDIGAGSGAISVEWCLACNGSATAIEQHASRVENIRSNAQRYAVAVDVQHGLAPEALHNLPPAQAVFVGGGFNAQVFDALRQHPALCNRWRLVVNAVTLETQALLIALHQAHGGELMQLHVAQAQALGSMRSWQPSRPVVQWQWQSS